MTITRDEVISRAVELPTFPSVVSEIIASQDDFESNLNVLSDCILHEPAVAARVLSCANRAAQRTRSIGSVTDIYTAVSLIGMTRLREIVTISSLSQFIGGNLQVGRPSSFRQHSVAVGVSAQELALHVDASLSSDNALISGLLHDIGELWFCRFRHDQYKLARQEAKRRLVGIEIVEREWFSADHAQIGGWLGEYWGLPAEINAAITHHTNPDNNLDNLLVPVVAIAEVFSNGLDLCGRSENKVTQISKAACTKLGVVFDRKIQPLFGRIEARSRHANLMFSS